MKYLSYKSLFKIKYGKHLDIKIGQKRSANKKQSEYNSKELIQEVKESPEDYKKGNYVKGDVKDIMKPIREY